MKKLLLILSFLASQLLAIECTQEQYKPYDLSTLNQTNKFII